MARLFDSFTQLDSSSTRSHGGTGLGLTICRQIVEQMGGAITVDSTLGAGSTFTFTACFRRAPEDTEGTRDPRLPGGRCLLLAAAGLARDVIEATLEDAGLVVETSEGGVAGLQKLREAAKAGRPFGALVIDATLPGTNGFTVAAAVAQDPALRTPTVMLLDSHNLDQDLARCREQAVAGCLIKPPRRTELLAALREALDGRGRAGAAPGIAAGRAPAAEAPAAPVRILLAEDNPPNEILLTALLQRRGWQVDTVGDGQAALRAVERGSFDLVLMDVQMPGMDGLQATRAIRSREAAQGRAGRGIPIIGVTAHAMRGDRERCLDAGMDAYLTKPVDAQELFALVERCLNGSLPGGTQPPLDAARLLTSGGPAELAARVRRLRDEQGGCMEHIQDAIVTGDTNLLNSAGSRLRTLLADCAAAPAAELAAQLQQMGADRRLEGAPIAFQQLDAELRRVVRQLDRTFPGGDRLGEGNGPGPAPRPGRPPRG